MSVGFTRFLAVVFVGLIAAPALAQPAGPAGTLAYKGDLVVAPASVVGAFTYTTNGGWAPVRISLVARHQTTGLLFMGAAQQLVAGNATATVAGLPNGKYDCWALMNIEDGQKNKQIIAPTPGAFKVNLTVVGVNAPALAGSVGWSNVNPNPAGGVNQITGKLDSSWNQGWNCVLAPAGLQLVAIPTGGGRVHSLGAVPLNTPNMNNQITIGGVNARNDYTVIGTLALEQKNAQDQVIGTQLLSTGFVNNITVTNPP